MRNILLIEPNYSNKYPPIGLMKIATYHRILGDNVRYFKGDLKDLAVEILYNECVEKMGVIDNSIDWTNRQVLIKQYIKYKKNDVFKELEICESRFEFLISHCLNNYADNYKKKQFDNVASKYDRIYVTTLFTFYWKITVETIHFCKKIVKDETQLFIGGVLASLLHKELELEVGIKPMKGLLDIAGQLDPENPKAKNIIVDNLALDYSILDEVEYEYPTRSAYFTFMTKGCTRKCTFCSVPILEPTYKPKIETIDKFHQIREQFGEQQNLLLMDNNVLASPNFSEIVDEIKEMGFYKGATFVEPNQLEITIKNLQSSYNNYAFTRRAFKLLNALIIRLKNKTQQDYYRILAEYSLLKLEDATKENILLAYPLISKIYEKYRLKSKKLRYVDFNQGTDCRYVTEELMKKMSEIPIRPLRIAFDYIGLEKQYVTAVKLAAKYNIKELSNYILYNFQDKPEDLYKRLEINTKLCLELDISIFSFPMKYIPLFGEEAKTRTYTGKHWNKKFIRAVQSILNVSKGIVAPASRGKQDSFFYKAFGKDIKEFTLLLYMPEVYIIYRYLFEETGLTQEWRSLFEQFSKDDLKEFHNLIKDADFKNIKEQTTNEKIINILPHYLMKREDVTTSDTNYLELKARFNELSKNDQFIELTLTYDFEEVET